jgi:hypothetical protein
MKTPLAWRPEAGGCRVELVGLVPQSALLDSALPYRQVMGFTLEDTVEQRLDSILGEGDYTRGRRTGVRSSGRIDDDDGVGFAPGFVATDENLVRENSVEFMQFELGDVLRSLSRRFLFVTRIGHDDTADWQRNGDAIEAGEVADAELAIPFRVHDGE